MNLSWVFSQWAQYQLKKDHLFHQKFVLREEAHFKFNVNKQIFPILSDKRLNATQELPVHPVKCTV